MSKFRFLFEALTSWFFWKPVLISLSTLFIGYEAYILITKEMIEDFFYTIAILFAAGMVLFVFVSVAFVYCEVKYEDTPVAPGIMEMIKTFYFWKIICFEILAIIGLAAFFYYVTIEIIGLILLALVILGIGLFYYSKHLGECESNFNKITGKKSWNDDF